MDTDERLAKLEQRVEEIEKLIQLGREKLDTWAKTPAARKLAGMVGLKL